MQGIIKQLIAVPSAAGIEQLLTVYGAGRVAWNEGQTCVNIWNDYDALMIDIKTAATSGDLATAVTKANVLANALCAEIAKMTYDKLGIGDTAGERINLYLGEYGIGLTMGVTDRVKADD